MGLFGGGNSSVATTTLNTEVTNTVNSDVSGAAGSSALILAPSAGGNLGSITGYNYNAPIYLTPSVNTGDSAVKAAAQVATAQITASGPSSSFNWSTLFEPPDIYWIIGAVLLLMLARGHHAH